MTDEKTSRIRTRFAPSPTGTLHLGSIRTALFSWLYARHHGGKFILRIEDTDRQRSTKENLDAILEGLTWLGLEADEGPFFQSQRFDRYGEVVQSWLEQGKAYRCYCTKKELDVLREEQINNGNPVRYDGRCRDRAEPRNSIKPVIRFKNPIKGEVVVKDFVRGHVVFQNTQLDDLIIARPDGSPTYNFAVVVDDYDMGITHVIRGDDHLNNTPRQLNMLRALGAEAPVYAHLPMILGADGTKLSKRHGAVDIREYQRQGYLPEAMLNYLVRLGWSHGNQEIFSVEEMIDVFDLKDVNHSASSFNPDKLLWLNQHYIMNTPTDKLGKLLLPFLSKAGFDTADGPKPSDVAAGFRERAQTLADMASSARYCYEDFDQIDDKSARKHLRPVVLEPLQEVRIRLSALANWSQKGIHGVIEGVAHDFELSLGKIGQPIRVAVTGGSVSPPIDVTLWLVGKERTLQRLDQALDLICKRTRAND